MKTERNRKKMVAWRRTPTSADNGTGSTDQPSGMIIMVGSFSPHVIMNTSAFDECISQMEKFRIEMLRLMK